MSFIDGDLKRGLRVMVASLAGSKQIPRRRLRGLGRRGFMRAGRKFWVLLAVLIVCGGCILQSPQYHLDMYCGRVEAKTFPLTRYWFYSYGTGENFNGNVVCVPFAVPLAIPIGISLDLATDLLLSPLDALVAWVASEEDFCVLQEEKDGYRLTLPIRKPTVAYVAGYSPGARLYLIEVKQGALWFEDCTSLDEERRWTITPTKFYRPILESEKQRLIRMYGPHSVEKEQGLDYARGSRVLLCVVPNRSPFHNIFPFMRQPQGHQWFTGQYGVIPPSADLTNHLREECIDKWSRTKTSYPRIDQFLLHGYEFNGQLNAAAPCTDSEGQKVEYLFHKSHDFQGTVVELGLAAEWVKRCRE